MLQDMRVQYGTGQKPHRGLCYYHAELRVARSGIYRLTDVCAIMAAR